MLMAPLTLSAAQRRPGSLALDGIDATPVTFHLNAHVAECWFDRGAASTAPQKATAWSQCDLINDTSQRIDRDQCTVEGRMRYSSSEAVQYHSGCIRWDHLVRICHCARLLCSEQPGYRCLLQYAFKKEDNLAVVAQRIYWKSAIVHRTVSIAEMTHSLVVSSSCMPVIIEQAALNMHSQSTKTEKRGQSQEVRRRESKHKAEQVEKLCKLIMHGPQALQWFFDAAAFIFWCKSPVRQRTTLQVLFSQHLPWFCLIWHSVSQSVISPVYRNFTWYTVRLKQTLSNQCKDDRAHTARKHTVWRHRWWRIEYWSVFKPVL